MISVNTLNEIEEVIKKNRKVCQILFDSTAASNHFGNQKER